ncbi:winged helix-turn-helix domain-containing protein [Halomarina oriensis]|uniref:Helix-turn-helix domain-containing protein n=1 Tax=Halomarina oriensis TaxID=671145 RepID=A0A6B0GMS9_9EURY|nr:helix-turn-helix domain-containing protein [Halomarina oriensis]MWG36172.1 helix-turn-helix domain-containing protein [Halomarina oriensis]
MDHDAGITVDYRSPEEVFAVLGNETRLAILRAFVGAEGPLTFSRLRETVGMRDSGQFNYHLQKLSGAFIRESEAEDGYEPTLAGMRVVGALVAGNYTADATIDPIDVDDACPTCEERPLRVTFEDDQAHVRCPHCESFHNQYGFPPGTIDQYSHEELPQVFDRWLWTLFQRITAGFCVNCAGRLDGALVTDGDEPRIEWRCDRCGDRANASVTVPVLYHPATQGFLYDHGVDPTTTPSWRIATKRDRDVEETDDGVTVRLTVDGETVTGRVAHDGSVTDVDRSDR